jgi:Mg2+/Co2+ transporter CorB
LTFHNDAGFRPNPHLDTFPLWLHLLVLFVLLLLSAFFSIAETSMMALNRYRLSHLVVQGKRGALLAAALLKQTERLLGTILLGNNLVNTALTAMVTALAIRQFGGDDSVLLGATVTVAFILIVFCEITPKVIGATYPEKVALPASFVLRPLMRLTAPAVWFVNRFSGVLLWALRVDTRSAHEAKLSPEELRTIVLESGQFMPDKHRTILLNLFDLEHITVDDVMVPRGKVEALNIATSPVDIAEQLATCYHNKLPVYEGELNEVIGVLHVRRALGLLQRGAFGPEEVRALLTPPYFIPQGTPVFTQLQFFQENRQRLGLVVDEYGEVLGLVTLEDIIEEIIGEFTTHAPGGDTAVLAWNSEGQATVDGTMPLREVNRRLGTHFPLDGPKTLSGWILETLRELPSGNVSVRFEDVSVEVLNLQGRTVRSARIHRLPSLPPEGLG